MSIESRVAVEIVEGLYRALLCREADDGGRESAGAFLTEKGYTGIAQLVSDCVGSPEYRDMISRRLLEDRSELNNLVKERTGMVVQSGPFSGMKMVDVSTRGDGDICPKLLGVYEQELHPAITRFSGPYDAMVDVGCAEGYYSVGLALLHPGTPMMAFDSEPAAIEILDVLARLNDCQDQIVPGATCDPATLISHLGKYPASLILSDCEGYEKSLFTPDVAVAASRSDIIIECHDLWDADCTPSIVRALRGTHDIETVYAGARNPNAFEFLSHLPDAERWRAVWERRGNRQHWLVCTPLAGKASRAERNLSA